MKEGLLTQDAHDDEKVHLYSVTSRGTPWLLMATFHIDDVAEIWGKDIFGYNLDKRLVPVKLTGEVSDET